MLNTSFTAQGTTMQESWQQQLQQSVNEKDMTDTALRNGSTGQP
jgi:hypothetical protein